MTANQTSNESTANEATTDEEATADQGTTTDREQAVDPTVVAALSEATVPLSTTDPEGPFDDLAPFADAVADAEIVGLGEATHGSREFFDLKARLIRFCVEELGTRTVGFEANVGETLTVDEYVTHGEGTPEAALEAMYFWTWKAESVRNFLEWLREFNADRALDDRVRFFGFDVQYTQGSVDRLREYFERVDPEFLATVEADLAQIADDGEAPINDEEIPDRLAAGDRVVPRVRDRLDERRAAYVEAAGQEAWTFADRHLATIERALAFRETHVDSGSDDLVGSNAGVTEAMVRARETAMADSVDWLHERTADEDGPLVCWGHDAHVAAGDKHHGDVTSPAMGAYLRERHGDDYRPLGFTFGRGDLRSIGEVTPEAAADVDPEDVDEDTDTVYELRAWEFDGPLAGTVDAALDAAVDDLALLDCREAAADDRLAAWLATERPHHSAGATFDPDAVAEYTKSYAPGEAFDLLVHVPETTATRAP